MKSKVRDRTIYRWFLSGADTVLIAMTCPRYQREMRVARDRLSTAAKSAILIMETGGIEFAVKGE